MASEALFQALAQALSQPSKAYRAAQAGLEIPENALKGYESGAKLADKISERKFLDQTLTEQLGRPIAGAEEFSNMTGRQLNLLAKPLDSIGDILNARIKDAPTRYLTREQLEKQGNLAGPNDKLLPDDHPSYNEEQLAAIFSRDPSKMSAAFGGRTPQGAVNPAVSLHGQALTDSRGQENIRLRNQNIARVFSNDFQKDPSVVQAFTQLTQSKRAKEVLAAGNPIGDASVKIIAARAAGEVGNLAQPEQLAFGGSPALTDWLSRNAQRITTGRLDETDRGYLNELFNVYENYANKVINQRKQYHSGRYAQIAQVPIEEADRMIGDLSVLGVNDQDAEAEKWLAENPNAPEANAVRAKLQSKRGQSGVRP